MSKLQQLIISEREEGDWYAGLSDESISRIAAECGRDEIADAYIRLKELKSELVMVPDWDGDTQDDIWRGIELLQTILAEYNK